MDMKKIRFLIAAFVSIILLFGTVCAATAAEADVSGTCGANLTWTYEQATGVLTITGTGKMDDYNEQTGLLWPWYDYGSQIKRVVITEGVESIGNEAFSDCMALEEISIPGTVKTIGDYAFWRCTSLTSIVLPEGVTQIGNRVWAYCSGLTSAVLPDSLTAMGSHTFIECYSLHSVKLPSGLTTIPMWTFYCCPITSVEIPETITVIEKSAFRGCNALMEITIPRNVTEIGSCAFGNCGSLKQVTFLGNAPEIYVDAFKEVMTCVNYPVELSWDEYDKRDYMGTLTWIPYESVEKVWMEKDSVTLQLGYSIDIELLPHIPEGIWKDAECISSNISVVDSFIKNGKSWITLIANGVGSATVTVETHYGKELTCQVKVVDRPIHQVTEGTGGEWRKGSIGGLSFLTDGEKSLFNCMLMDEEYIDPTNFTIQEENGRITLKAEYLGNLSTGTHALTVIFRDGTAETTFAVRDPQEQEDDKDEVKGPSGTQPADKPTNIMTEPTVQTEPATVPQITEPADAENTDTPKPTETQPEATEMVSDEATQATTADILDSTVDSTNDDDKQKKRPWIPVAVVSAAVLTGGGIFLLARKRGLTKLLQIFCKK